MKPIIKYILLALFAGLAIFSGIRMLKLELWGHLPLLFFGSLWAVALVFLWNRISSLKGSKNYLMLSLTSGLMLSAAFPPMPGIFFMFAAFVPLLWVEKRISEDRGLAKWEVFKFSFCAFLTWNILSTYWVTNTLFLAGLLAMVPNAVLMSIPLTVFHSTRMRLGDKLGYPAFITYWIVFEYIHLNWKDFSWPWLTLGNSFARFPEIVQWYEYTGVFGGSLWILLANLLIFRLLERKYTIGVEWKGNLSWILPTTFILLPAIFSIILYSGYKEEGKMAEVVVVQPNYEPHYEKFAVPESVQIKRFLQLASQQVTDSTDYLVFPETSFDGIRHNDMDRHPIIVELKNFVDSRPHLKLVTGLSSYRVFTSREVPGPMAPRLYIQGKDTTIFESYNSAIQLSSGQTEIPVHLKSKLVPGPEVPPLASVTRFLKPFIDALGGTMEGLGTQKERSVFSNEDDNEAIAPVICYESVFGEYVTEYIRKGASAIFIITNDGWWDNTAGHKQHLLYASLRAVETRRSIARSANTGISAFINQRGDILQATRYGEQAVIKGKIAMNHSQTFYSRYGDMIARIAVFCSAILLLSAIAKWIEKRKK